MKLARALRDALGLVEQAAAEAAGLRAALATQRELIEGFELTMAAHADKLAAHDAYEARIAALEAR